MKMNISRRLFIYIILIILAFAALILVSNTLLLKPLYHFMLKNTMISALDDYSNVDYSADIDVWLSEIAELSSGKSYDIVIKNDDIIIFSSSKEVGLMSRPDDKQITMSFQWPDNSGQSDPPAPDNRTQYEQLPDGTYVGVMQLGDRMTELMVCYRQIDDDIMVFITQPIEQVNESVNQANILLLAFTFLSLVILSFVVLRISKRFTKPIREIQGTVSEIANLNFDKRCDVKTGDELQSLGENVNMLANELQGALSELEKKNEQLKKDIEAQKKFIANASHELRTPLSLITGYSEELRSGYLGSERQSAEYSKIIAEEAAKMNRLLSEMLELSRMQSGQSKLQNEVLDVTQQIKNFLEKYDGYIEKNGLDIHLDFDENSTGIFDPDRFEQVLANYISNAARYGDSKKTVRLSTHANEDYIRITVFNTGSHIDSDKLESIWDGFFKLDDSRTRVPDSYGLGLSVVKAIQEAAGMGYGARNVEDGVEFWFDVKRYSNNAT